MRHYIIPSYFFVENLHKYLVYASFKCLKSTMSIINIIHISSVYKANVVICIIVDEILILFTSACEGIARYSDRFCRVTARAAEGFLCQDGGNPPSKVGT